MAQTSYFWDGTTLGDATLAPYDDSEIAAVFSGLAGSFVVPEEDPSGSSVFGYLDELDVKERVAVGGVTVYPGSAMVDGVFYISTETKNVTIPATPDANPAIYRVVLQKSAASQTVRIVLKEGTSAANPEPPSIDSNELGLAWIWVDGAYNPAADVVQEEYIHDERIFRNTGYTAYRHKFENLLPNPQFYGISSGDNAAPDGWKLVNTPLIAYTTSNYIVRGNLATFLGDAGEGIETTVPINRGVSSESNVWTLKGSISVAADFIHVYIYGQVLGGASVLLSQKTFGVMTTPNTGTGREGITEFIMRVLVEDTYDALNIRILCDDPATSAGIGDLILTNGYNPGTKENACKHEIIWLDNPLTDASWTATAKSTGDTTISLDTSFSGVLVRGIRGIIATVRCRDSGSAAAAVADGTSVSLYPYRATASAPYVATISCTSLPNDSWEAGTAWVAVDPNDSNVRFNVRHVASGASTLDVTIEIVGIIT